MCPVKVDASQGVARVIFDETSFLGIEYDANIGEVITLDGGEHEIVIYNGAETGPLTFMISFSGAFNALAGAATATVAALATLL